MFAAGAINNLGQVAGRGVGNGVPRGAVGAGLNNAVVWQNGSIINLDPQQHYGISYAVDLTNPASGIATDVQVVGFGGTGDVLLWVGGTMYDTLIPYSNTGSPGWALAISDSGVVAGGYHPGGDPSQTHAFVWKDAGVFNHTLDPGELQDLNSMFPNATSSTAEDIIDASGPTDRTKVLADAYVSVAGGGQQWRAYLLTDQGNNGFRSGVVVTDLGTLHKSTTTQASAINNVGQVAGYSGSDAFLWQAPTGPFTDLGQFAKRGWFAPIPGAINHSGKVVGHVFGTGGGESAWVWTGNGSIQDLNGLIPQNTGWFLQDARGINDAGQNDTGQIVVDGQKSGSNVGACLLTPISAPAAVVKTSVSHLSGAETPIPAHEKAVVHSPLPRTVVLPSNVRPQDSPIPIPLPPATDEDLTSLATELIHSGAKRSRPSLRR
jgi:hypothetical protein